MARLHLIPVNVYMHAISTFPERKMLVTDMSDLHPHGLQPLYDDAADQGIALYNPKRDTTTVWCLSEEKHDNEGELLVSILKPTEETMRKYPQTVGWEFHILND